MHSIMIVHIHVEAVENQNCLLEIIEILLAEVRGYLLYLSKERGAKVLAEIRYIHAARTLFL